MGTLTEAEKSKWGGGGIGKSRAVGKRPKVKRGPCIGEKRRGSCTGMWDFWGAQILILSKGKWRGV